MINILKELCASIGDSVLFSADWRTVREKMGLDGGADKLIRMGDLEKVGEELNEEEYLFNKSIDDMVDAARGK